jgi:galactokinase
MSLSLSAGVVDRALQERGLEADERARLVSRFGDASAALQSRLGRNPERVWWVPGRLEVFGKHTDYAGGRTLVAALPRGFAFTGASRADGIVRILDARADDCRTFGADDGENRAGCVSGRPGGVNGWARYVAAVLDRFRRNFPGARLGADLAFVSDLPQAAGASSSSALTVGTALGIARLNRLDDRFEWRANLPSPIALAGYLACVENGLTFGTLAGGDGVGTHGGSEDHTAMLCCRPESLSQYSFVPVRHIRDVTMPDDWAFVVAVSGVAAEKTGPAHALYNGASLAAKALLDIWSASETPAPSLAAALSGSEGALVRLRELVRHSSLHDWSAADLDRRLAHFVAEDGRVPEAAIAFQERDSGRLADLASASQRDADVLLRNQIDETNALADLARRSGAFAASAFGAGFGGSVWALTGRREADAFGHRWVTAYRQRYPPHDRAAWFVARPSSPAIEIV